MRVEEALVCLSCVVGGALAANAPRPRGVSLDFAKYYKDTTTFSCISNPAIQLPFARVNDDYCDCPDGSDEPGTSACAHLSPLSPPSPAGAAANVALALPGFYCKNKGHIPAYLPFTNVNDGICDYELCCDGSEEWAGVGGVKCEDRCKEIGKEWKKHDEARQKSLGIAARKRKELVTEAARIRQEVQDRVQTLKTEIEGTELKVKQLEAEVKDVERRERGKVVKTAPGQKGGKMSVLVGLAKSRMAELHQSLTRVRRERDDYSSRLQELENLLMIFKAEYNPNFNDEGVKRAVRAWEEYAARDKEPLVNVAADIDLDEILKSDKDSGLDWDEYEGGEDSETDALYTFENYLPPSIRSWLDQKLRDLRIRLIEAGFLADNSGASTESKALSDARAQLEKAQQDLENHREDLETRNEELASKDFGPDDVFRALKGTCVSTDSGEYTYEVCFLQQTTQKPKKGGGHTNMGNFVRLETIDVDEELPANGKGLGSGRRLVMRHEGGQHCWNGPDRSSSVILACAEENEIWKIMEEEKCVYRLEVGTPAVCDEGGSGSGRANDASAKDEL
ncbi:glucosidase II beta subunit-like protein-domain-containing protein [Neohortaea acidophila]|uniref:Glucosidase 2 subunit beta n=1 Tax=Neohortaea acidophila TaxID=245834 RepID=A0A6A6Q7L6_9PEZI|nr:glucosidase II beta subunit-like protein-domain-containing protein [Neohortaea acidophila]KAF2488039.1 glucosidase II beta subunit-like protein-domain-containing protein [Neohortaea acidophila]